MVAGVSPVFSQAITFQIAFGGSDFDVSRMMMELNNNGYILTGKTYTFGSGGDDIYTVGVNSTGQVMWSKTYGTSGNERSNCIARTLDGCFAMAGYKSVAGAGNDVCLIKIDSLGNLLWAKSYGGALSEEAYAVCQTSDSGYILVGYTDNYASTLNLEMYVIKTDGTGTMQWGKTYGVTGFFGDEARDVVQTPDKNLVIVGQTSTAGMTDVALLKINKNNGTVLWAKKYDFSSNDNPETLHLTTDGGFIIAGDAITGSNEDIFLLKTDSDGVVQWAKTYGDTTSNRGWGVIQTSDGGFAVTGTSQGGISTGKDLFLLKTNSTGDIQFMKTMGSVKDDNGYIIWQTTDNGYAVAGFTSCDPQGPGFRNFILSKTDEQGNLVGTCNLLAPGYTTAASGISGYPLTLYINTFGSSAAVTLNTFNPPTQNVVLCNVSALPIELVSFNAEVLYKLVVLNWQTASEINNDFFTAERSKDSEHFEKVGNIDGHGYSIAALNYSLTDEHPYPGLSYYRLKQTDFDDRFTYSQVVSVNREMDNASCLIIYPNPASDFITIYLDKEISGDADFILCDVTGEIVYRQKISSTIEPIPVSHIKDGMYCAIFNSPELHCIHKLMIR